MNNSNLQFEQLQTKQMSPVLQLEIAHPQRNKQKKITKQRTFATCIDQTSFTFAHKQYPWSGSLLTLLQNA